ncbi:MAG TPA: M23 family metallopeptidase [Gaiellaceae bacterium]|nr:M23 family metallopeptidase [Gaiellaceae bacterium]
MRSLLSVVVAGLCAAVLLAAGRAGAETSAPAAGASARAFAIRVTVPGQPGAVTAQVAAPPDAVSFGASFAYPADGSAVTSGAVTGSASASAADGTADGSASASVESLSLFGGELTVAQVSARASATARDGVASGDLSGASVTGLVVAGQPVEAAPGLRVPLGDWGYALVLPQGQAPTTAGFRGFVTGLEIHLTADHGGLATGSTIAVGYAEAAATAPKVASPAPAAPAPPAAAGTTGKPKPSSEQPSKDRRRRIPPIVRRAIPSFQPKLTEGGFVFPVHGPASFVDTFGAGRAVVGWHHGEDIFAPMGAPILAVTSGTLFSVGWNDIGGLRFWLRDDQGNEFYYAHLSAYSPLAIDGARVRPGDVVGFVGNSGDADTTPPHLHFEIHPSALLGLGYDGVINPYRYLQAWQRLDDVRFIAGAGWVPVAGRATAPSPGAYLLSSTDISSASGLDPGSLRRAMAKPVSVEEAGAPTAPAAGSG